MIGESSIIPWHDAHDLRMVIGAACCAMLFLLPLGTRRAHFGRRAALCCALLLLGSAMSLSIIEHRGAAHAAAPGYFLRVFAMTGLFMGGHCLCYRAPFRLTLHMVLTSHMVYRMTWDLMEMLLVFVRSGLGAEYDRLRPLVYVLYYALSAGLSAAVLAPVRRWAGQPRFSPSAGLLAMTGLFLVLRTACDLCTFPLWQSVPGRAMHHMAFFLAAFFGCSMAVLIPRLHMLEAYSDALQRFIEQKRMRSEAGGEGILALQVKCHDLKHQIARIRSAAGQQAFLQQLDELENALDAYNTVVDTGREAIDVVLTEKSILCRSRGIQLTYMIDGSLFGFMPDEEVYLLLGNALDSAIERAAGLAQEEARIVSLKAARRGEAVVLRVESAYDGARAGRDDASHGFAMRAVERIAARYGGQVAQDALPRVLRLTVILSPGAGERPRR